MGDQGGLSKEQLKTRFYSLVVQMVQKGAPPESIIPRLLRAGFSEDEARDMVNTALGAAGASVAPVMSPPAQAAPYPGPPISPPPYMPPATAPSQEVVRDITHEYANYAGFWIRFLALFIDNIIISFAMLPFNMVLQFSGLSSAAKGQPPAMPSVSTLLLYVVIAVVIPWLYFSLQESSAKMSTIGKRVCGLVVTDLNGQQISFGKATARFLVSNISYLTLGIGFVIAAFTQKRQTLHDIMVGTVVISTK